MRRLYQCCHCEEILLLAANTVSDLHGPVRLPGDAPGHATAADMSAVVIRPTEGFLAQQTDVFCHRVVEAQCVSLQVIGTYKGRIAVRCLAEERTRAGVDPGGKLSRGENTD